MKRVISIFICMVMLIGMLPANAFAGTHNYTINSVSIRDLDYPIAGKTLDNSYSVPTGSGVYYTKSINNSGVTWYDLGTSLKQLSDESPLEGNAVAQNNHYYVAKIELMDVVTALNYAEGAYFANNVTVEYTYCPNRLKNYTTQVSNTQVVMTVYLYFKADYLYSELTFGPALSVDSSLLYYNESTWEFEVQGGTVPFTNVVFDNYDESHFEVKIKWLKKTNNTFKTEMDINEKFVAGEEYMLRVMLNSDLPDKNATFENGDFFDVYLNNIPGEKNQISLLSATVDFICSAKDRVNGLTIEGIKYPEAYADMQTTGFTVGDGVKITSAEWYQTSNVEFDMPVTGQFKPNTKYRLYLYLEPKEGYILNLGTDNIEVNAGTLYSYSNGIVKIDFSIGSHTCNYGTWQKDVNNHWKVCSCGAKAQTAAHTYGAGVITTAATYTKAGVKTYTCTVCGNEKTEEIPMLIKTEDKVEEKVAEKVGTVIVDVTGESYKVTVSDVANGTVEYAKAIDKNVKKVIVPDTVTINGITYKVTSIAKNAFSGCKKLTSVKIGKYVTTIGAKAFYKCTALKAITIPSSVKKIGKSAFEGCKKLKTIKIKTTKLTNKKVGSKAFKGTAVKAKVTVPKKSLKAYKKFLYKKGLNKKAKIKK